MLVRTRSHSPTDRAAGNVSSPPFGKHAAGATGDQSSVAEPSFAERARTLMHLGRIGSLSTLSPKQLGFPFGYLMLYGLDSQAAPHLPDQHHGHARPESAS
jgi:hypothetical protein